MEKNKSQIDKKKKFASGLFRKKGLQTTNFFGPVFFAEETVRFFVLWLRTKMN